MSEDKCYILSELEERAENLAPSHSFTWETWGTYGRPKDHATGTCKYCKYQLSVKIYDQQQITGDALENECFSVNRTVDPEGLAVTTWAYCRKCDKKIAPKNKNEVLKGFHARCQNDYQGTIILDIHSGMIQLRMKTE